jgi:hypothetical protein
MSPAHASGSLLDTILPAIAAGVISLEYLPVYFFGQNYSGPSINWLMLPLIFLLDVLRDPTRYFNLRLWRWIALVVVPVCALQLTGSVVGTEYGDGAMAPLGVLKMAITSQIVFAFFFANCQRERARRAIFKAMLIAGIVSAVLQLASFAGFGSQTVTVDVIQGQTVYRTEGLGSSGQTIYFVIVLVASAFYILRKTPDIALLRPAAALAVGGLCIFLAATRGAAVGMIVAVAVGCIYLRSVLSVQKFVALGLVFLVAAGPFLIWKTATSSLVARASYGINEADDSVNHRILSYEWMGEDIFRNFRLTGCGFGVEGAFYIEAGFRFPGAEGGLRWPHSSIVDSYVEGGIPLMVAYIALWFFAFRSLHRSARLGDAEASSRSIALLIVLTALFVSLLFLSDMWVKYCWMVLGFGLGPRDHEVASRMANAESLKSAGRAFAWRR